MSTTLCFLIVCLAALAAGRPEISDKAEARDNGHELRSATEERNPVLEYIRSAPERRSNIHPGGKREITFLQVSPPTKVPPTRPNLITGPPQKPNFQRDPSKSPYENFNGFILAGRKPDENLVNSPVLKVNEKPKLPKLNQTWTQTEVLPAIATVLRTYDQKGQLKSSLTKYEPYTQNGIPETRQQLSWPYAGYFPILIKDPFLTAFNALVSGSSLSFSSLVEYGPEADICRALESKEEHEEHKRRKRSSGDDEEKILEAEETGRRRVMANEDARKRRTRLTVSDPERGLAAIQVENPDEGRDSFYQAEDIEARANRIIPPLSTIILPPVTGYDERKKKPSKPEKEESEENVGEEEETSNQESSDAVAISPPPEGASVAEAKPVGLAIAGPGGVASSKPVAQAIVGPGGLAIARPVATAVAGVEVDGAIPINGQQSKKPQKKKPKQEYENESDELQYVGGFSGPIGSPKPKHTPPQTNYIGGLKGVVGNPIPKHETPGPHARQSYQFRLGQAGGKYGFLPFAPANHNQARTFDRNFVKRMENPTYFHGMIGNHGHNMPASVYPLIYY